MRRRDIRAARRESVAQDWGTFAANDERDEFDYQSPRCHYEPDTADSYQRDAISAAPGESPSVDAAGTFTD